MGTADPDCRRCDPSLRRSATTQDAERVRRSPVRDHDSRRRRESETGRRRSVRDRDEVGRTADEQPVHDRSTDADVARSLRAAVRHAARLDRRWFVTVGSVPTSRLRRADRFRWPSAGETRGRTAFPGENRVLTAFPDETRLDAFPDKTRVLTAFDGRSLPTRLTSRVPPRSMPDAPNRVAVRSGRVHRTSNRSRSVAPV